MAVATSYVDTLNERLRAYLAKAGFEVIALKGLSITGVEAMGEVSTSALVELSASVLEQVKDKGSRDGRRWPERALVQP